MRDWWRFVRIVLKVILPIVTVAASILAARWLVATKPAPAGRSVDRDVPPVAVVTVEQRDVCFPIHSQGTVQPRLESTLAARVAGRIVSVAECFDESGFFRRGEVLAEIERRDYEVRIRRMEAGLRAARAETLDAKHQLDRVVQLRDRNAAAPAELDRAQSLFDMSTARAEELEAQLEEARNALKDTTVAAPFDGCVREKHADVGQYVTPGTPLATCFATDAVEVRLPVGDHELAFLDLALGETHDPGAGPDVVLEAEFAGSLRRWKGSIVRSEAIVDSRSRMVYLVAHVPKPYERTDHSGGHPLAVGMFVAATIRCNPVVDAIVLPASCVAHDGKLFVVDPGGALRPREVEVLRREGTWVVVQGDLSEGESVCATPMDHAVPGLQVEVIESSTPRPGVAGQDGLLELSSGETTDSQRRVEPSREGQS